jgi:Fe-S oxidoreductase
VVKHVDRCLSCLSCMTTCPSGVHYMHLVDHARAHIEETYSGRWSTGCCAACWPGHAAARCSAWR